MHDKMGQACELGRGQLAVVNLYYKLVRFYISAYMFQFLALPFNILLLADHL